MTIFKPPFNRTPIDTGYPLADMIEYNFGYADESIEWLRTDPRNGSFHIVDLFQRRPLRGRVDLLLRDLNRNIDTLAEQEFTVGKGTRYRNEVMTGLKESLDMLDRERTTLTVAETWIYDQLRWEEERGNYAVFEVRHFAEMRALNEIIEALQESRAISAFTEGWEV